MPGMNDGGVPECGRNASSSTSNGEVGEAERAASFNGRVSARTCPDVSPAAAKRRSSPFTRMEVQVHMATMNFDVMTTLNEVQQNQSKVLQLKLNIQNIINIV